MQDLTETTTSSLHASHKGEGSQLKPMKCAGKPRLTVLAQPDCSMP